MSRRHSSKSSQGVYRERMLRDVNARMRLQLQHRLPFHADEVIDLLVEARRGSVGETRDLITRALDHADSLWRLRSGA